jgi:hypothetical protein
LDLVTLAKYAREQQTHSIIKTPNSALATSSAPPTACDPERPAAEEQKAKGRRGGRKNTQKKKLHRQPHDRIAQDNNNKVEKRIDTV